LSTSPMTILCSDNRCANNGFLTPHSVFGNRSSQSKHGIESCLLSFFFGSEFVSEFIDIGCNIFERPLP